MLIPLVLPKQSLLAICLGTEGAETLVQLRSNRYQSPELPWNLSGVQKPRHQPRYTAVQLNKVGFEIRERLRKRKLATFLPLRLELLACFVICRQRSILSNLLVE